MVRLLFFAPGALALAGCSAEAGTRQVEEEPGGAANEIARSLPDAETQSTQPAPPALPLTGRVVDAADILSPEFEALMTDRLARFETETQAQFVLVATPSLNGQPVDRYTIDLGNAWGIGSANRNDGIILLIAPSEGKARLSVGLGLEDVLTPEVSSRIMTDTLVPYFRTGDYEAGADRGIEAVMTVVREAQASNGWQKAA